MKYYLFSTSTNDMSSRKYSTDMIMADDLDSAVTDLKNKYRYHTGLLIETMFVEDTDPQPVAIKFMRELIKAVRLNRISHSLLISGIAAGRKVGKPVIGTKLKNSRKTKKTRPPSK